MDKCNCKPDTCNFTRIPCTCSCHSASGAACVGNCCEFAEKGTTTYTGEEKNPVYDFAAHKFGQHMPFSANAFDGVIDCLRKGFDVQMPEQMASLCNSVVQRAYDPEKPYKGKILYYKSHLFNE